ncbi:putative oxygenase [Reticulomyxa filosa]|uniref:Putative oxygenase n=1 Tax=Reticulomyxa filosa TaxID=46433 RepID=X6MLV3_RETFI|nr:putative oxygenase [Reticulomyxa filosa]|eukprot:ETO14397.1 putative oxygenase [Reticulomyxa filosa]
MLTFVTIAKVILSVIILSIVGVLSYKSVRILEELNYDAFWVSLPPLEAKQFGWIGQGLFFIIIGIFLHYSYSRVLENRQIEKDEKGTLNRDEERSITYPSQYPNGWYFLVYSKDIKKGQVKNITALGQQLVVFRGESVDYTWHTKKKGKVCGDLIECPFHKWKFALNGVCKDIPYSDKNIPTNANATAWPCAEYHDMVCIYYHSQRKPPCYTLPIQPDIANNQLVYRGSMDAGIVRMHIQEFAENAGLLLPFFFYFSDFFFASFFVVVPMIHIADWMHFDPVHGRMMIPFTRFEIPVIWRWLQIQHIPGTVLGKEPDASKYGPTDPHFMYFLDEAQLKWKGKIIPNTKAMAVITFCGPAGICFFRFNIPEIGNIVLFHTHLPSGNMKLRVRFHWYADRNMPRILVWYVVGLWISQWSNDIDIWENKGNKILFYFCHNLFEIM